MWIWIHEVSPSTARRRVSKCHRGSPEGPALAPHLTREVFRCDQNIAWRIDLQHPSLREVCSCTIIVTTDVNGIESFNSYPNSYPLWPPPFLPCLPSHLLLFASIFSLFLSLSISFRNGHPLTLALPPFPSALPANIIHHPPQHARNPLPIIPKRKHIEEVDW